MKDLPTEPRRDCLRPCQARIRATFSSAPRTHPGPAAPGARWAPPVSAAPHSCAPSRRPALLPPGQRQYPPAQGERGRCRRSHPGAAGLSPGLSRRSQEIPETVARTRPGALAIETRQTTRNCAGLRRSTTDPPRRCRGLPSWRRCRDASSPRPCDRSANHPARRLRSTDGARILRCRTSSRHDRPEDAGNRPPPCAPGAPAPCWSRCDDHAVR